jgi:hypothetical protein
MPSLAYYLQIFVRFLFWFLAVNLVRYLIRRLGTVVLCTSVFDGTHVPQYTRQRRALS